MLTSIEHQDVIAFKNTFIETAIICNWNEQTSNTVLVSLTATNLIYIYNNKETVSEKLEAIISKKYSINDALRYYNKLSNIKQNNFLTITEYKTAVDLATDKLSFCKNWNNETRIFNKKNRFTMD